MSLESHIFASVLTATMAEHIELGKWGEEYAAQFLQQKGYIILDRDWRYGRSHRDLDIVCKTPDQATVVFVEVKTRSSDTLVKPERAVNREKVKHIGQAANQYVKLYHITERLRFDIITIVGRQGSTDLKVNHIEHAFNPLLF